MGPEGGRWRTACRAAIVALALTLHADPSVACTCGPQFSPEAALATADAVFEGRVRTRRPGAFRDTPFGLASSGSEVELEVRAWWKGQGGDIASVETSGSGACGLQHVAVGQSWVIYASERRGSLMTGMCTRSTTAVDAERSRLGPPRWERVLPPRQPSALELAIAAGAAEGVRRALASGARTDEAIAGGMPLNLAVASCAADVVTALVEGGAQTWQQDIWSCPEGQWPALLGALDLNDDALSAALRRAVRKDEAARVALLLDAGRRPTSLTPSR